MFCNSSSNYNDNIWLSGISSIGECSIECSKNRTGYVHYDSGYFQYTAPSSSYYVAGLNCQCLQQTHVTSDCKTDFYSTIYLIYQPPGATVTDPPTISPTCNEKIQSP